MEFKSKDKNIEFEVRNKIITLHNNGIITLLRRINGNIKSHYKDYCKIMKI